MFGVLCAHRLQDMVLKVSVAQLQPRDHVETGNTDLEEIKQSLFGRAFQSIIRQSSVIK